MCICECDKQCIHFEIVCDVFGTRQQNDYTKYTYFNLNVQYNSKQPCSRKIRLKGVIWFVSSIVKMDMVARI